MLGWHHQLSRHESEPTPGDSKGQGSLVCYGPLGSQRVGSQRVGHDLTMTAKRLNTISFHFMHILQFTKSYRWQIEQWSLGIGTRLVEWVSLHRGCMRDFFCGNGTVLYSDCDSGYTNLHVDLTGYNYRGAWWAAVHGVTKSWTRLSD